LKSTGGKITTFNVTFLRAKRQVVAAR